MLCERTSVPVALISPMATTGKRRRVGPRGWSQQLYEDDWASRAWSSSMRLPDLWEWTERRMRALMAAAAGRPTADPLLGLTVEQNAMAFHVLLMSIVRTRGLCGGPDPRAVAAAFVAAELELMHELVKRGDVDYVRAADLTPGASCLDTLSIDAGVRTQLQHTFGARPNEVLLAPFEDLLSILPTRKLVFVGDVEVVPDALVAQPGWALVPLSDAKSIAVQRFTDRLERLLDRTRRLPCVDYGMGMDPRMVELAVKMRARFVSSAPVRPLVVTAARSKPSISLETALRFAPTCIRSSWDTLVRTGTTKNDIRLLLSTFFREVGVQLPELLTSWCAHASARHGHHKGAEYNREVTTLYLNARLAVPACRTIVTKRSLGLKCAADVEDLPTCQRACVLDCGARFTPSPKWYPISAFNTKKKVKENETVYF